MWNVRDKPIVSQSGEVAVQYHFERQTVIVLPNFKTYMFFHGNDKDCFKSKVCVF